MDLAKAMVWCLSSGTEKCIKTDSIKHNTLLETYKAIMLVQRSREPVLDHVRSLRHHKG